MLCPQTAGFIPQCHPPPSTPQQPVFLSHWLTFSSRSLLTTTYCLPPTVVNLPTARRCQKEPSLASHSCVSDFLCVLWKEKQSKLWKSVKYEYSVCLWAYVTQEFVDVCVCVGFYCMFSGGLVEQESGCQKWIGWEVGTYSNFSFLPTAP